MYREESPYSLTFPSYYGGANSIPPPKLRFGGEQQSSTKDSLQSEQHMAENYPQNMAENYPQKDIKQHIESSDPIPRSYSTGDLKTSIRAGEQQTKVVNENIEKVESHFPQFVQDINLYTVRSAKLRDAGDNFAKSLQVYAESETRAVKQGINGFAECFAAIQDHRNILINRLENKVVEAFSVYETKCKQTKIDVKQHNLAHTKEVNVHKSFEKVKGKSTQQFQLAKAEAKFKKASEEATRSAQILIDQVSDFERQKTVDLKNVFGEFMLSEMLFYSKALEIYTHAYQELMNINEVESIDQLRKSMKLVSHEFGQETQHQNIYGGSAPTIMNEHDKML